MKVRAIAITMMLLAQLAGAQTTPQYMPRAGGSFTGPVVTVQSNITYTPAPGSTLQSTITTAGASSDIALSCGTYSVGSGLSITAAGVHLHGIKGCTVINFTSTAGITVSGAGAELDGIKWQGATSGHTVEFTNASSGSHFHDNIVTGSGSAGGAVSGSTALLIDAPNTDIWVEDNEFYGNGTASGDGYVIRTDGAAAGYVQKLHMHGNWIHGNTAGGGAYLFDIANSDVTHNVIDQNNQCAGTSCQPGLNGIGYALASYSEAFMNPTSLSRTSGVVTAVGTVGFTAQWPLNVGDQVFLQVADFGAAGTDFNGVFAVTSISVDRKTITWAQAGVPDDTGSGSLGVLIAPLQNNKLSDNRISNAAASCIYVQGNSDIDVSGNILTQCDLQANPGSLVESAIGIGGLWGGTVTDNNIDGVGLSSGIGVANDYFTSFGNNTISNVHANGMLIADSFHLTVDGNTIQGAPGAGITTNTFTKPSCFGCSFGINTIRMVSPGSAYAFNAADSNISITGGSIHAPSNGLSNSAIALGIHSSSITVTGVTIYCQPDGATAAASTVTYGIRSFAGGSKNVIKGNTINGCNGTGGAGIVDASNDDVIDGNTVNGSTFGILANGGNRQLIKNSVVWGNSTPISTSGSTGAVLGLGNQTAQGGPESYTAFDQTQNTYRFGGNTNTVSEWDLNASASHQKLYCMLTAGVGRWCMVSDSDAETGSNAGSPFRLYAISDGGTTIDNPISIVRAAGGAITFSRPIKATALAGGSTFCLQIDASGLISNTGATCGGGGGGGSVSTFAAPSGSWPAWLVPTVSNPTTTPSLAVTASAIPNSALAHPLPTASDTNDTVQVDASGNATVLTPAISGTWEAVQNGGADNTGSVDASTILNAETTAICSSSTPVRIHLAAGTYKINSSWTIAATSTTCKNLVIEGDGSGNTILQGNCSSHPYVVAWINSTSPSAEHFNGPTFRHMTVKNTGGSACALGLEISQSALFKVEDVIPTGFAGQTYSTGTIASTGSTVTGSGTTWTAAMVHGFIETTSVNTTTRSEVCGFTSTTSLTLCASSFPTGNIAGGTAYGLAYGGDGLVCDPGAGISGSPFTQYATIKDVYASGNLIGIHAWGTTSGGCSRVQVTGNAGYISPNPGSRVTDAVGIYLGHNSDTWEISSPLNNAAACIVNDSGHTNWINGAKCENGGSFAPVTTCNGGVGIQACTVAWEVSADSNGDGWNTSFNAPYAYKVGNVFQYDNSGGAFNSTITAPRDLSGQYTLHYSFYGTTGCPGNASGIPVMVTAYDCNHQLVTQTVN